MPNHKLVFVPAKERTHFGQLCVEWTDIHSSNPVRTKTYYPCSAPMGRINFEHLEGLEVSSCGMSGTYRIVSNDLLNGKLVYLLDGGSTKSIKYVEEPIPPPKVRRGIELRWQCGRWEKLTKKGWVWA